MALVIIVPRDDHMKFLALTQEISALISKIGERENDFIIVPLSGKLVEVINVLKENSIRYTVTNEATV